MKAEPYNQRDSFGSSITRNLVYYKELDSFYQILLLLFSDSKFHFKLLIYSFFYCFFGVRGAIGKVVRILFPKESKYGKCK
jgi:hypothetical protein